MSRKFVFCLVILALLCGAVSAAAQGDTPGGDILISTYEYDDCQAAVAYNSSAQEFLVVWSHQGNIYGQRYDIQGVPQGENFAISTAPNGKYYPAVAYSLHTDSYLVVWEDHRNIQDSDIYGQLVDADGTLLDNPTTPEDETYPSVNFSIYIGNGNQQYVDLAFDGDEYLVVWQGNYQNDSVDVLGRFVDDNGTVELTVLPLGEAGSSSYEEPAVAYNAIASEYLVVFQYGEDTDAEIRARRVDPSGLLPGDEYTIADQSRASGPDVVAAASGAYIVVWSDYREPAESNIYGRVVLSGADSVFDGENFAISIASANQFSPIIARSPSTGRFLVVWKDGRQDAENSWNLYGQRLLADANLVGQNFVISNAVGDQKAPAIAASQSPDLYFVAWEDRRSGAYDLYGQRVAWTGALLWYEFAISAQPDSQSSPAVAYGPDDEQYLIVWEDYREGAWAIYGQRLSADGRPLEEAWAIEAEVGHDNREPDVVYNSQRRYYLVVWADTSSSRIEGRQVYPGGETGRWSPVAESDNGRHPRLEYDEADDLFLVVWEAGGDIYAHALNGDSSSAGGDSTLVAGGNGQEKNPALAFDGEHRRYLVVWDDDESGAERIYGRLIDPDGTTHGAAVPVTDESDGLPRYRPAVDYNPDADEYLVVYEREAAYSDSDICGQQVSHLGGYGPNEIVIRAQPTDVNQVTPDVVYVPEAVRYYVVWSEYRDDTYGYDLYCRWLESDGSMATTVLPFFQYPFSQSVPQIAYNPNGKQGLIVWDDNRRSKGRDIYARLGAVDVIPPTASFTRDPAVGRAGTTFIFDAGASSDNATPPGALTVRWDFNSDGNWDTVFSYDKVITETVVLPNTYTVTLEVRDLMGLTDTLSLPISVQTASSNTPPTATLAISPTVNTAGGAFTFDASGCTDAETVSTSLQVRWDWENDGTFDTLWSGLRVRMPVYTDAGLHTARVEVRDQEGLTGAAVRAFLVLPGDVVTLTVHPGTATLAPGETLLLRATAWDTYTNQMNNPAVVWSVADPQAGAIDASGVFTAGRQAGEYPGVILATSGSVTDTASVTIVWPYQLYLPLTLRNY